MNTSTTFKGLFFAAMAAMASCTEPSLITDGGGTGVKGCTDPASVNYNPDATVDDASCVFIQEKQNSVFVKFTATWCGPCGDWGAPAFTGAIDGNKGKLLGMSLQVSDNLTNAANGPIVDQFSAKWAYTGTPNFAANEQMVGTSVGQAVSIVNDASQLAPTMGVGLRTSIGAGPNTGKINIDAYIKNFADVTGVYHLAIYFLAREIVETQKVGSTNDPNFVHHHVLMGAATSGGAWGEEILPSGGSKGGTKHWAKAVAYDPSLELDQMEIVAVIWKKKTDGTFEFVNSTNNR
jgi:hypothetical protein